ncbi:MAG: phenylacetate--CoA ligase family protein, partial [Mycobacterium sp.]
VLGTDPHVSEYQVTQTAAGADIVVVGEADTDILTVALIAEMRRHGLSEPTIRIRITDSLQRHQASGKLRRFIPLQ